MNGTQMRDKMIKKVESRIETQKSHYEHLKEALTDFKDSSLSALGKVGYATSTIEHQRLNMMKGF